MDHGDKNKENYSKEKSCFRPLYHFCNVLDLCVMVLNGCVENEENL